MSTAINGESLSPQLVRESISPGTQQDSADRGATRLFLGVLRGPSRGCTELRILRGVFERGGRITGAATIMACTRGDQPWPVGTAMSSCWSQLQRLHGVTGYVTINPVRSDLLARSDNHLSRVRHTTRATSTSSVFGGSTLTSIPSVRRTSAARPPSWPRPWPAATPSQWPSRTGRVGDLGLFRNGAWVLVRLPDYANDPDHLAGGRLGDLIAGKSTATRP